MTNCRYCRDTGQVQLLNRSVNCTDCNFHKPISATCADSSVAPTVPSKPIYQNPYMMDVIISVLQNTNSPQPVFESAIESLTLSIDHIIQKESPIRSLVDSYQIVNQVSPFHIRVVSELDMSNWQDKYDAMQKIGEFCQNLQKQENSTARVLLHGSTASTRYTYQCGQKLDWQKFLFLLTSNNLDFNRMMVGKSPVGVHKPITSCMMDDFELDPIFQKYFQAATTPYQSQSMHFIGHLMGLGKHHDLQVYQEDRDMLVPPNRAILCKPSSLNLEITNLKCSHVSRSKLVFELSYDLSIDHTKIGIVDCSP